MPNISAVPASKPLPTARASGPVRTQRKSTQARVQIGPLPAAQKARISGRISSNVSRTNETPADTHPTLPIETEPTDPTEPAQREKPAFVGLPSDDQPPASQPPDISGSVSHTSGPPNLDPTPPATDDMSVDEDISPVTPTASSPPCDCTTRVESFPALGTSALVQTSPPALLLVDEEERPGWLLRSVREFLKYGPYYLCLDKVVDLFLTQEARLGYPAKVSKS